MTLKKYLQSHFRGWLPIGPQQSENRVITKGVNLDKRIQAFLRIGGLLLPIVGTALIALFSFGALLTLYDPELAFKVSWPLFLSYIAGIAVAIVGVTFRVRSTRQMTLPIRKSFLVIGLALLTVSVLGYLFDYLASALNVTYPYDVHSLLVRLLIMARTWWFSPMFLFIGFGGCLILLVGRKASLETPWASSLLRGAFYVLVISAIISFGGRLFDVMLIASIFSSRIISFAAIPLAYFYAFVYPFAILGLTFGWVILTSAHLSKRPFLFPTLYTAFLIVAIALFSISI